MQGLIGYLKTMKNLELLPIFLLIMVIVTTTALLILKYRMTVSYLSNYNTFVVHPVNHLAKHVLATGWSAWFLEQLSYISKCNKSMVFMNMWPLA